MIHSHHGKHLALYALFIGLVLFSFTAQAQMPQGAMQKAAAAGRVYGKIVDSKTGKPVEFAAVQLSKMKLDSASGTQKETILNGQLTEGNGDFNLEGMPVFGEMTFKVSSIGYKPYEQKVSFNVQRGNMQQVLNAIDKDLGNIKIEPSNVDLQEVTIDGTATILELRPDKKVYNVEKNPIATGGTAEDVLKNVPSVNVDIDGNVTMRNAAPQIFIDGRPTTLTVDQIPADAIQEIELISNPSAKYDASGGMAGILNIVLKKNKRVGYNGSVRTGVDSRGRINAGADINAREGKVNWFLSGNLNQRRSQGTGITERYNFAEVPATNFTQNTTSKTKGYFGLIRSGFDIFLDNRNTFTIAGSYNKGKFNPVDELFTQTDTLLDGYTSSSFTSRNSDNERTFMNTGGTLAYKHLFPKEGKEITADMNFNSMKSNQEGNYITQNFNGENVVLGNPVLQQQVSQGENTFITAQTDFVTPLKNKMKLEAGLRGAVRNYSSVNQNFIFNDSAQSYYLIPDLTANYKFTDQVYAAHATFSQQVNRLSYQIGARVESSFYTGELTQTGQKFNNDFPVSLFPSASLSCKMNEKNDINLIYSRKINRPTFFQLIPFTDYSDSLNLSKGNPDLKPEFTNSIEISWLRTFSRKNTLLASIYFKHTDDVITRYINYQYDSIIDRSVLVSTFQNANSSYAYGVELTSQNNYKGWLDINANINAYQSVIDGGNIEKDLSNEQFSWFAKLNLSFKLPKNFTASVSGDYQSRTALQLNSGGGGGRGGMGGGFMGGTQTTAQGYMRENYGVDAGLKYEFWKDKAGSLTFNISDIFKTKKYDSFSESAFYTQNSLRKRDAQIMRLTFSYRFGKFDTSLFKRKNNKVNTDTSPDMGM